MFLQDFITTAAPATTTIAIATITTVRATTKPNNKKEKRAVFGKISQLILTVFGEKTFNKFYCAVTLLFYFT